MSLQRCVLSLGLCRGGEARSGRARDGIYCVNCVKNEGDTLLLFDFACYNSVIDLKRTL